MMYGLGLKNPLSRDSTWGLGLDFDAPGAKMLTIHSKLKTFGTRS